MRAIATVLLLLCLSSAFSYGASRDAPENGEDSDPSSVEGWPADSSMDAEAKALTSLGVANDKLNMAYQKLLQSFPKDDPGGHYPLDLVISVQNAWQKYRSEFCNLYGFMTGGAPAWQEVYRARCEASLAKARTDELEKLLACVTTLECDAPY